MRGSEAFSQQFSLGDDSMVRPIAIEIGIRADVFVTGISPAIRAEGAKAPPSAYRLRSVRSDTGLAISAMRRLLILSRKVSSRSFPMCF